MLFCSSMMWSRATCACWSQCGASAGASRCAPTRTVPAASC